MTDSGHLGLIESGKDEDGLIVALSGGVGGAKLAVGLDKILSPSRLIIAANTGDDFEHLGLHISPDIDTLMYALAGVDNPETGWGRRGETWSLMEGLAELGGETWFRLGDRDIATHLERTRRLRADKSLSSITAAFANRFKLTSLIVPMTDDRVRTLFTTADETIAFQDYFVRRQCEPSITGVIFEGARGAAFHPRLIEALKDPRLRAIILCPSNPFISIDPILSLSGARKAIADSGAPVIAVSPIIGGEAVKGPTSKMMRDLGLAAGNGAILSHYRGLIDGLVIDKSDEVEGRMLDIPIATTTTLMQTLEDRKRVARVTLELADSIASTRVKALKAGTA